MGVGLGLYEKGDGLGLGYFYRNESRSVLVPNFHLVGVLRSSRLELWDPGPGISSSRTSTKDAMFVIGWYFA